MQQQQNSSQKILTTFEYQLFCSITNNSQSMKLMLSINSPIKQTLYADLNDMQNMGGLNYICRNFYDVRSYLRDIDNFSIDMKNKVMIVYGRRESSIKKFLLVSIPLKQSNQKQIINQNIMEEEEKNQISCDSPQKQIFESNQQMDQIKCQNLRMEDLNPHIQQQSLQKNQQKIVQQVLKQANFYKMQAHMQQMIYRMQQKSLSFHEFNQKIEKKLIKFQQSINNLQQQRRPMQLVQAQDWIDTECYFYKKKRIIIKDNFIMSNGQGMKFFFGKQKIPSRYKFYVKIHQIGRYIGIGISYSNYILASQYKNQFVIHEYRSNKRYKNTQENVGLGFVRGETVQVDVDMEQGRILWKVNNQIRYLMEKTISNAIYWVPFVIFSGKYQNVSIFKRY